MTEHFTSDYDNTSDDASKLVCWQELGLQRRGPTQVFLHADEMGL